MSTTYINHVIIIATTITRVNKNVEYSDNNFSNRLKGLIEDQNISQKTLADSLGVTRQAISLYINGQRTPDIKVLEDICAYFNVTADYLLGRTSSKSTEIEDISISNRTGLSDCAIKVLAQLKRCNKDDLLDLISLLIEQEELENKTKEEEIYFENMGEVGFTIFSKIYSIYCLYQSIGTIDDKQLIIYKDGNIIIETKDQNNDINWHHDVSDFKVNGRYIQGEDAFKVDIGEFLIKRKYEEIEAVIDFLIEEVYENRLNFDKRNTKIQTKV